MSPREQLDTFIDRFTPEIARLARAAIIRMRKLTPGALELVYDNYNALAIGFGPSEKASEAIFSIALFPRWVSLFFLQGADLPDPAGRLSGTGKTARHIILSRAETLDEPDVLMLIDIALAAARVPLDPDEKRRLIIKSVSARQRPRRPTETAALRTRKSAKRAGRRPGQ